MLALAKVESDNGQNLNHKEVTNPKSMYFGQKAIGTWAIMPGNIDPTMNTSGSRNSRDSWLNFAAFKEQFPEITPDANGVELFKNNKVTGIIDFFFTCHDTVMYDLSTLINSWFFTNEFNENKTKQKKSSDLFSIRH